MAKTQTDEKKNKKPEEEIPPPTGAQIGADLEVKDRKKKTVEVDADTLQKVMDKLEKQEKDISILREAADKGRLGRIEDLRNQGKLIKTARMSVYNGQIVKGWVKVKDDVYIDSEGRLHEQQVVRLFLEDDSTPELDYRSFSRLLTKIEGEVVEEGKDKDGNSNVTILFPDGKKLKTDVIFIN